MAERQEPDGSGVPDESVSGPGRPHIRPPRSDAETVCLGLAWIGLVALLALTAYWLPALPATIPTHFGLSGQPNASGSKYSFLLLPALLTAMTVGFTLLARYPWIFNYPVVITAENAARNYRRGRMLLRIVNAVVALVFVAIQWQTIQIALGKASALYTSSDSTIIIAAIMLIPIAAVALIVWRSVSSR